MLSVDVERQCTDRGLYRAVSLAIGVLALVKLAIPAVDPWIAGRDLFVSGAVLGVVLAGFCVGMRSARRGADALVRATDTPARR